MAKAYFSANPDTANQAPLSLEGQILADLHKDKIARTFGAYATKQTTTSYIPYRENMAIGILRDGGAVTPSTSDQQISGSFPVIRPNEKKLSEVNAIYYFYNLDYFYGTFTNTYTPTNFEVPVYLTMAKSRYNYNRNFTGYKYEPINSFKIGNLSFQTSNLSFYLTDINKTSEIISGRVDWTDTIPDRPVVSEVNGIVHRDFIQFDPTKITISQKQEILNGSISSIVVTFCVDITSLSQNNQDFLVTDVAPNFTFFGGIEFNYFGLGVAYTPLV